MIRSFYWYNSTHFLVGGIFAPIEACGLFLASNLVEIDVHTNQGHVKGSLDGLVQPVVTVFADHLKRKSRDSFLSTCTSVQLNKYHFTRYTCKHTDICHPEFGSGDFKIIIQLYP